MEKKPAKAEKQKQFVKPNWYVLSFQNKALEQQYRQEFNLIFINLFVSIKKLLYPIYVYLVIKVFCFQHNPWFFIALILFMTILPELFIYLIRRKQHIDFYIAAYSLFFAIVISVLYIVLQDYQIEDNERREYQTLPRDRAADQYDNYVHSNQLFILGGICYVIHFIILQTSNFILNALTSILVNAIYTAVVQPSIQNAYSFLWVASTVTLVIFYRQEKKKREDWLTINKLKIWYFVANYIVPQKFIITQYDKDKQSIQLNSSNYPAQLKYHVNSSQTLNTFMGTIQLEQIQDDDILNMQQSQKSALNTNQNKDKEKDKIIGPITLDQAIANEYRQQESPASPQLLKELERNKKMLQQSPYRFTDDQRLFKFSQEMKMGVFNRCSQSIYKAQFMDGPKKLPCFLRVLGFRMEEMYQLLTIEDDQKVVRDLNMEHELKGKHVFSQHFAEKIQLEMDNLLESINDLLEYLNENKEQEYYDLLANSYLLSYRLLNLVNFNRYYCFLDEENAVSQRQGFQLSEVIEEILDLISPQCEKKKIEIIFKNECTLEEDNVKNDHRKIMQILLNFLLSSVECTKSGRIVIHIIKAKVAGESSPINKCIKVHIRDTGSKKWQADTNIYDFSDKRLQKAEFADIELALVRQLLKTVGPFDKIFTSNDHGTNKISFYVYCDIGEKMTIQNNNLDQNPVYIMDEMQSDYYYQPLEIKRLSQSSSMGSSFKSKHSLKSAKSLKSVASQLSQKRNDSQADFDITDIESEQNTQISKFMNENNKIQTKLRLCKSCSQLNQREVQDKFKKKP